MFTSAAIMFAIVMGFFMSMTVTFCISLYFNGLRMAFLHQWLDLWPLVFPIVVFCIIVYRPLSLNISGRLIRWWQSSHPKSH